MAAAIGTEFAFKTHKVRYLSLNMLLEFSASILDSSARLSDDDDYGPPTIVFWPWRQSQVLIIDDIGPIIAAQEPRRKANLAKFSRLLEDDLKPIAAALAQCHTIWILGDLRAPDDESTTPLDEFAKVIANYCSSPGQPPHDPLVIELEKPAARSADRKLKSTAVRRMKLIHLDEPGGKDQDSRGM
jgi:hypothetical protein